jgi:hypothetical protein
MDWASLWAILSYLETSGTDVMILKLFLSGNCRKKCVYLTQNKAKLCMQNFDHNIGF